MRLAFSASIEVGGPSPRVRFAATAALTAAALVAIAALTGLVAPATYARETAIWRAEAISQDWANLFVDVPWLVASALFALRGSRRARLLLAGGLVYTAYTYATYAFAVRFNALFLIYCGALGTSAYALRALSADLRDAASWFSPRAPVRLAGGFAMACALAFAALWLAQIIPALARGTAPAEVEAAGLLTNPVHVLDLALVLPAMFTGGWLLWNRRPGGYAVVTVLLGFTVVMAAALTTLAIPFVGLVALAAGVLVAMLRAMRPVA